MMDDPLSLTAINGFIAYGLSYGPLGYPMKYSMVQLCEVGVYFTGKSFNHSTPMKHIRQPTNHPK